MACLVALASLAAAGGVAAAATPATVDPTVASVSPSSGTALGGTMVDVTGTHLTGATAVDFGTVAGTDLSVYSPTSLSVVAPAGTGTVDVTVHASGKTSPVSTHDKYTYLAPVAATPVAAQWGLTTEGGADVTSVDCAGVAFCVAVGHTPTSGHGTQPLAYIGHPGAWTAEPLAVPAGAATGGTARAALTSVSCPQAGTCVAVGTYGKAPGGVPGALVEQLSGGAWTALAAPLPATLTTTDSSSYLRTVTCPVPGWCVAVGNYTGDSTGSRGSVALVETLASGTWTHDEPAVPGNALTGTGKNSYLGKVACAAVASCAADGGYVLITSSEVPFLVRDTTGTWASVEAPTPGGGATLAQGNDLALSCPAAATCVALVEYGPDATVPVAYHLVGTSWSHTVLSPPPGTTTAYSFTSLTCPEAGSCVAVGYWIGTGAQHPVESTLAGGEWTSAALGLPAGAAPGPTSTVTLLGVSCTAAGVCTAVGHYAAATRGYHELFEQLSAGTWTALAGPGVATGTYADDLAEVSCADGTCAAAGHEETATGQERTVLLVQPATGYDLVGADGGVFVFNPPGVSTTGFYGSLPGIGVTPDDPVVGIVPTVSDDGYFLVTASGGVFAFGAASYLGSTYQINPAEPAGGANAVTPTAPIVGIVAAKTDKGYFLVGKDGGVFAFGTAPYAGSLPQKGESVDNVIGIAATPNGSGYWVVQSTGTVTAFGTAKSFTTGATTSAVTAIAGKATGGGYWLVTAKGGVYPYGDATKAGTGTLPHIGVSPASPVIGIVPTDHTAGYWLLGADGGIFAFNAPYDGSLPGLSVHVDDIVGAVPN